MLTVIKTYRHLRLSKHLLCFGIIFLFLFPQKTSQANELLFSVEKTCEEIETVETEGDEEGNVYYFFKSKKIVKKTPPPLVLEVIQQNISFGSNLFIALSPQQCIDTCFQNFFLIIHRYIAYHSLIFYEI